MASSDPFLFFIKQLQREGQFAGAMTNDEAAPDLVPKPGFKFSTANNTDVSTVNVVDDFQWTQTPKAHRQEVPFIRMSEYRVNFNSLMMNLRYFLSIPTDRLAKAGVDIVGGLKSLEDTMTKRVNKAARETRTAHQQALKNDPKTNAADFENFRDKQKKLKREQMISGGMATALNEARDFPITPPQTMPSYLRPYYGLYGATTSGFEYYFPYFQTEWKGVGNTWNETSGGGLFQFIFDQLGDSGLPQTLLNTAAVNQNVLAAYIERPKMYNYDKQGKEYSFTFTLLNTDDELDVIRNWHLVFMLSYQNLPNRTSKVQLEPPVIYEIEVPGQFYSPFAIIKNMAIKNVGAQRRANIDYRITGDVNAATGGDVEPIAEFTTPDFNPTTHKSKLRGVLPNFGKAKQGKVVSDHTGRFTTKNIETIIPDAYEITITVESLLTESKNLFWHSANKTNSIYQASIADNILDTNAGKTARNILGAGNRLDEY